jgi:hypothetical protein
VNAEIVTLITTSMQQVINSAIGKFPKSRLAPKREKKQELVKIVIIAKPEKSKRKVMITNPL